MSNDVQPFADDRLLVTAIPASPQKKGQVALAWLVIVLVVGVVLWLHTFPPREEATESGERVDLRLAELTARFLVGAKELSKASGQDYYKQAKDLDRGPLDRRLRFVILAGEFAGPAEARAQLNRLAAELVQAGVQPTPEQAALLDDLRRLYSDYTAGWFQAPSVSNEQRQQVRQALGWFGELALAPPGGPDAAARAAVLRSAYRTVVTLVSYVIGLSLLGVLGLGGLVVFVIFLFSGKLRRGVHTGLPHGGVYAETFAVWMVLFLGLSIGAALIPSGQGRLLLTGLAFLLSLAALYWPVLRGIPWQQVRWEIGLNAGKQPALEPLVGVATYAMALPMLVVGALVMFAILAFEGALSGLVASDKGFDPVHVPSHPVVHYLFGHDWWTRLQVLLLASVIAPIVEETMFRGVLYRHLREASAGLSLVVSVLFSAGLVSFLFAVVHPQGLEFVPILMGLAVTFCLVREWRGTLAPVMAAHGIFNGLTLLFLILTIGD